jgi:translation initiation factor IF-3
VVDEEGTNLGVMKLSEALALAEEKGLDVVEVAPNIKPPVVKIISYDKFRYQQRKEEKKHAHKPTGELKQVRITPRAADNDLKIRANQAKEFLEKGNKVEIMMTLRGREKYNQDWARKRFNDFIKMISANYQVTMTIRPGGRGLIMQIMKGK